MDMGAVAVLTVVASTALVGVMFQRVGHAHEPYEWANGMVGALYGGLLGNAILGPRMSFGLVVDGLNVVPELLAAIIFGGLLVVGSREFDARRAPQLTAAPWEPVTTQTVTFSYAPQLLHDAVISQMSRQFGVNITPGRVEIVNSSGWVELEMSGTPAALEAALNLAARNGLEQVSLSASRRASRA